MFLVLKTHFKFKRLLISYFGITIEFFWAQNKNRDTTIGGASNR
jgi:hypothetical protein